MVSTPYLRWVQVYVPRCFVYASGVYPERRRRAQHMRDYSTTEVSIKEEITMGLYFEEFFVGQKVTTVGRTMTEYDIVTFAGLSGDYNQIHTDAEFSKNTPIGQRIAHGILGLSIASGLAMRTGILEGTVIVFREMSGWKFVKPIFIGDTIHVDLEVKETKAIPRIGGGAVSIELEVKNQKDEVCQRGIWNVLVLSKPKE